MMNVLFGLLTALFVAVWGVGWYRQQSPAAVARSRLAQPARPPRTVPTPAPRERADRLVPLVRAAPEPEMESIAEPFFAESAPPRPRSPRRLRRTALTPIPEGPRLAVEPLTADERLGDFTPPRSLAEATPPAEAPEQVAAEPGEPTAASTPPAEVTTIAEAEPGAPAVSEAVDLAAIEEPFFAAPPVEVTTSVEAEAGAPAAPEAVDLASIEGPVLTAPPVEVTTSAEAEPGASSAPDAVDLAAFEEPFFAAPPAPVSPPTVETPPPAPPVEARLDGIAEPFFGIESAPAPELVGYCARCQAKRPVRDVIQTTTRKGRPARRGHCATCGAGMFIFVADER